VFPIRNFYTRIWRQNVRNSKNSKVKELIYYQPTTNSWFSDWKERLINWLINVIWIMALLNVNSFCVFLTLQFSVREICSECIKFASMAFCWESGWIRVGIRLNGIILIYSSSQFDPAVINSTIENHSAALLIAWSESHVQSFIYQIILSFIDGVIHSILISVAPVLFIPKDSMWLEWLTRY